MLMAPSVTNPRQRIIDHGEVFTPPGLVSDMLDLVAHECERIDSRFLEPACGDGNFLAEVLRRKLLTVVGLFDTALTEEDFQTTFTGLVAESESPYSL